MPAGTNYLKVEILDNTYIAASAELGQLTITYGQETNTTPSLQYTYATADRGSRLVRMTYPDRRVLHNLCNSRLDDAIGRNQSGGTPCN